MTISVSRPTALKQWRNITRAARRARNHNHSEYCDSRHVWWYLAIATTLCHGLDYWQPMYEWSFSGINLGLQLKWHSMLGLILRLADNSVWLSSDFFAIWQIFLFFSWHFDLIRIEQVWHHSAAYYFYWRSFTMQPFMTEYWTLWLYC